MPQFFPISSIKKQKAADLAASILVAGNTSKADSIRVSQEVMTQAKLHGLALKDYLRAAVESEDDLDGYEALLAHMNLPIKNDYNNQISIQASSDVFNTSPGSRVLFPEVITDMVKWKNGPGDQIVSVEPFLSQTRIVSGANAIMTMEMDDDRADSSSYFLIAEGGEIPMRKIKSTDKTVKMFKMGQGYTFTYEWERRANIDVFVPYVNRIDRQLEIDKLKYSTSILVNGDGVAGAITQVANTAHGGTAGTLDWLSFFKWLTARAAAGFPVTVVSGNYKTYADYMKLFTPVAGGSSLPQAMAGIGAPNMEPGLNFMNYQLRFAISNTIADNTIIGITKSETMEQLVEAGSDIIETDRLIKTQEIEVVRSQVSGFNLTVPLARNAFYYGT